MRCLITGGAGFIGSHLTEHLLGLGHEVVVLDDLSTGDDRNLAAVADDPRLRLVHGSVCHPDAVEDCMDGVAMVYHLAAAVGVFTILDKPLQSLRTNLDGTRTVLDAARRHRTPILVASTSEVYGKSTAADLREDDDRVVGSPLRSRWSYAEAKALDETLTYLYGIEYGLPTVIVRLFNTVGPRQSARYGMVIPRFVEQALTGEPVTVFGDGEQIRCFCHVSDVIPALVALAADENAYGTVYNLGNPEPTTILELARKVVAATGSASPIVTVAYAQAYGSGYEDMHRRVPNCQRIRERIGFRPRYRLADIVNAVIADRRERMGLGSETAVGSPSRSTS